MLTRRQFIRLASLAASVVLGMPKLAKAWGLMPFIMTSDYIANWSDWDETDESTLSPDNFYTCLFESTVAGTNDIGQGFNLSEANRTLTQAGAAPGVPGWDGTGLPNRLLDGTSDGFQPTEAWFNTIFAGQSKYFLCFKINIGAGYLAQDVLCKFLDTDVQITIDFFADKLRVKLTDTDNLQEALSSGDNITIGSIIYICVFCDGVKSYAGWTVGTKPTALTDFDAGKLITFTALFDNFASLAAAPNYHLFSSDGTNNWLPGNAYFLVASNTCPIVT